MSSQIVKIDAVSDKLTEQLFEFHTRFFDNLKFENFKEDLHEKDWIILLKPNRNELAGFSTIKIINDQDSLFLFSGDTIVAPEFWKMNLLIPAFGAFLARTLDENPNMPLYWLLISKGYRTYRFLPLFFKQFLPGETGDGQEQLKPILDYICTKRFGDNYDPARGIISFDGKKDYLNDELAAIPDERKQNKQIRFFLEKNPGYVQGDELACLAELSRDNIIPRAHKFVANANVEWIE